MKWYSRARSGDRRIVLPNLLIPGTQKSGTTWLHYTLKRSKHLLASPAKELDFFTRADYHDRLSEYEGAFPATEGASYYFESTPHYYRLPYDDVDIASRIATTLGRPRLLVIFRNPVERYESAYIHHALQGRLPLVEEIDELIDERGLLAFGRYASITEHWQPFGFDTKYLLYDDLSDKPALVLSVMNWLGLDNDIRLDRLEVEYNSRAIKAEKRGLTRLPRLGADARARLVDYYADEVARLAPLIGRDLSSWLQPAPAPVDTE